MFGFLKKLTHERLSYEQLQTVQFVAQQVVLSLEGSVNLPGVEKKTMALELMAQILRELGITAPESLIDVMLESAVSILKTMQRIVAKEAKPKFSFDTSARPRSGN